MNDIANPGIGISKSSISGISGYFVYSLFFTNNSAPIFPKNEISIVISAFLIDLKRTLACAEREKYAPIPAENIPNDVNFGRFRESSQFKPLLNVSNGLRGFISISENTINISIGVTLYIVTLSSESTTSSIW